MLNFSSRFGRHVNRRLRQEKVIWLTTVDENKTPQPRPVWFHWDAKTILIFSEKNKAKLRHIARNPRVSLNFNTDEDGGDVAAVIGMATVLPMLPRSRVQTYLRKYNKGIKELDMTVEEFRNGYSVPILVKPQAMRGFI